MAETRGQGTLYRQRNSRFWWYRIGFQGRILCASTKTTDRREAREVLKQKYRELEAVKGGFVAMPGPEAKRVTVSQLLDELLADYELHGRRSIKGVRSHVKRVREELGEIRAVDLKPKDLTEYQVARRKADAAGGTINRELALLQRAARRFLEDQKLAMPRVTALPERPRGVLHPGRGREARQTPAGGPAGLCVVCVPDRLAQGRDRIAPLVGRRRGGGDPPALVAEVEEQPGPDPGAGRRVGQHHQAMRGRPG